MSVLLTEEWIRGRNLLPPDVEDPKKIRALILAGGTEQIVDLGSGLSSFTGLRVLDLSRNALQDLHGLEALANLEKLTVAHNNIQDLAEFDVLQQLERLVELDVRFNPVVASEPTCRSYLIYLLPWLQVLDEKRVRDSERRTAEKMFGPTQPDESAQPLPITEISEIAKAETATAKPAERRGTKTGRVDDSVDDSKFNDSYDARHQGKSEQPSSSRRRHTEKHDRTSKAAALSSSRIDAYGSRETGLPPEARDATRPPRQGSPGRRRSPQHKPHHNNSDVTLESLGQPSFVSSRAQGATALELEDLIFAVVDMVQIHGKSKLRENRVFIDGMAGLLAPFIQTSRELGRAHEELVRQKNLRVQMVERQEEEKLERERCEADLLINQKEKEALSAQLNLIRNENAELRREIDILASQVEGQVVSARQTESVVKMLEEAHKTIIANSERATRQLEEEKARASAEALQWQRSYEALRRVVQQETSVSESLMSDRSDRRRGL